MRIKLLYGVLSGLLILSLMTGTGWCLTILEGSINVGVPDTLFESLYNPASLDNSGDATEIAWVNSVLGGTWTLATKFDTDGLWYETNEAGTYALDLGVADMPYFYIKTGNILSGQYAGLDHFLFQNNSNTNWAVINLASLGIEPSKVSHIAAVPEPATLLLLGFGLIGIVGIGRKRLNA